MLESTILKCIMPVQIEDITVCTESCRIMRGWREGVRESNKRG
jgi:hypothetical protein